MTTYNTGNPLGSADPRDLFDNAENLDEAVNSSADTFQDRLGNSRLTWAGIVRAGSGDPAIAVDAAARAECAASNVEQNAEQIAQDAASAVIAGVDGQIAVAENAVQQAETARDAAFVNADVYPDIAAGLAAVANGEQFQVVEGDEIVRYRRDSSSSQTEVARYPSGAINSLTVNRGKNYPLLPAVRGGVTSGSSDFLTKGILNVEVEGAKSGYYYALRYMKNGANIYGPQDGWEVEEVLSENFQSSEYVISGDSAVITYKDPAPDIDRSAGIQTITLSAPRSSLKLHITIDPSYLPAFGTPVRADRHFDPGYSWVIHPSLYSTPGIVGESGMSCEIDLSVTESGLASATWRDGSGFFRVGFGPNGANSLPNFTGMYKSGGNNDDGFIPISEFTTDWLPPLIFNVDAEADNPGSNFTGGNHVLFDTQTARNTLYRVLADGVPVSFGDRVSCERVTFVVVNELMAANTVEASRYALRQSFVVNLWAGVAEVNCEVRALEALKVRSDYGPQMVTSGLNDTQLILDGQYAGRVTFDPGNTSGPSSSYPDAWAVIMMSNNGQIASWLDHDYGVGTGQFVAAAEPRIRGAGEGAAGSKQYHAAIRDMDAPMPLAAGDVYRWRGGYAWSAPGSAPSGFDSILSYRKDGSPRTAIVIDASDYTVLP